MVVKLTNKNMEFRCSAEAQEVAGKLKWELEHKRINFKFEIY